MIEINLLPEELRVKAKVKKTQLDIKPDKLLYLVPVLLALLLCTHIYLAIVNITKNSLYRILNAQWTKLEPQKKMLESYNMENASLSENAKLIQQLTEQRISWSEKLNKLSTFLPSGIWFNELSYSGKELIIQASVISLQKDEMSLIAKLIDNLKNDPGFFNGLNNLELGPVQHRAIGSYDIADFTLTGAFKGK